MFVYFELVNCYWKVSDLENVRMGYCQLEDSFPQFTIKRVNHSLQAFQNIFQVFHATCVS